MIDLWGWSRTALAFHFKGMSQGMQAASPIEYRPVDSPSQQPVFCSPDPHRLRSICRD